MFLSVLVASVFSASGVPCELPSGTYYSDQTVVPKGRCETCLVNGVDKKNTVVANYALIRNQFPICQGVNQCCKVFLKKAKTLYVPKGPNSAEAATFTRGDVNIPFNNGLTDPMVQASGAECFPTDGVFDNGAITKGKCGPCSDRFGNPSAGSMDKNIAVVPAKITDFGTNKCFVWGQCCRIPLAQGVSLRTDGKTFKTGLVGFAEKLTKKQIQDLTYKEECTANSNGKVLKGHCGVCNDSNRIRRRSISTVQRLYSPQCETISKGKGLSDIKDLLSCCYVNMQSAEQ